MVTGYAASKAKEATVNFQGLLQGIPGKERFTEIEIKTFPWERLYTRDGWISELHTHSDHTALEPQLRQRLFDEIGRTIDLFGGSFRMPYEAILASAALL